MVLQITKYEDHAVTDYHVFNFLPLGTVFLFFCFACSILTILSCLETSHDIRSSYCMGSSESIIFYFEFVVFNLDTIMVQNYCVTDRHYFHFFFLGCIILITIIKR